MKKKTIALFILASLYGATASAESLTLEASANKVMQKMNELAELAKDPANVIQKGDQKYLSYKGKELRINFDGNIKFDLMDFHSEFNTVFDFIPSGWETYWYDGGFDIYPGKSDECKFELFAAARGSKDNEGNYSWERPLSTVLTTTGCPDVTQKESIFFNTNTVTNDLSGNLAGAVLFAQAHIIPANANEQEKRMHLVGERKTKVMLKPENELDYYSTVTVTATDKAGQVLGEIEMKNPSQLAPNVLSMPELTTTNIDFRK